ncbi:MAG: hypothetical protein JSW60_06620 [Thermoplasmatales archaeon]|nr:MAG: hypothetical protein JSW60_06620 [Thermoplasmatales archaeon]
MKKKIMIVSSVIALLLITTSLTSVIGSNVDKSNNEERDIESPLFTIRQQRLIYRDENNKINSNYLGNGKTLNILFEKQKNLQSSLGKTLRLLQSKPSLITKLLDKIENNPRIEEILKENDVSISEFKNYLKVIKNNPSILLTEIKNVEAAALQDPSSFLPLGLNSTNPFAIIILIFVLLPVLISLTLIIATATIITCLNLGGCFEKLATAFIYGFIQGLKPPNPEI